MKNSSRTTLRVIALIAGLALALAACGSDGDEDAEDSTETTAEETEDTTETTAEETEDTTETTAEETEDTTETTAEETEEAAGEDISVELGEWFVTPGSDVAAGTVTFAVENVGENPHAFAIARGTSYEDLPQKENGAVDTDALGDDFLGTTDNLDSGGSTTIDFDLEAGDYVFFCPVEFGPNSHAAAGQVLSVTVG